MYDDIADIYSEIFPLNKQFLVFIGEYLKTPGSTILDIACGPGDYVHELSKAGHKVTGTDINSTMIQMARLNKEGTFFEYSFTAIHQLRNRFDCIFCIGNSFSYLPPASTPEVVQAVSTMLLPKRFFILQTINWDNYLHNSTWHFPIRTLADGRTFHRHYEKIGSSVLFKTELRKNELMISEWSDELFPKTSTELQRSIETAGMVVIDVFADFKTTEYKALNSAATIIVAQKQDVQ